MDIKTIIKRGDGVSFTYGSIDNVTSSDALMLELQFLSNTEGDRPLENGFAVVIG